MTLELASKEVPVFLPEAAAIFLILVSAQDVYHQVAQVPAVITSGMEGKHKVGSKHYKGHAFDFRTKHIVWNQAVAVAKLLREKLGPDFDVILERDHLHVEWDPKRKVNDLGDILPR